MLSESAHILNGLWTKQNAIKFLRTHTHVRKEKKREPKQEQKNNNLQPIYYNVSVDLCVLQTVWDSIPVLFWAWHIIIVTQI